jgi:hypothetical protein
VYVVAVLEMPVTIVDMVDVVAVLNGLTPVVLGMRRAVIGVDLRLGVPLAVVDMVDVVAMRDGLVAVARQVLVVARFDVFRRCHGSSKVGLESGYPGVRDRVYEIDNCFHYRPLGSSGARVNDEKSIQESPVTMNRLPQ